MLALHTDASIAGILKLPVAAVALARSEVKAAADAKRALHRRTLLGRCDLSHNGKSRAIVQVKPVLACCFAACAIASIRC
jgi:hypothetical protein